jgi:hypothetical protein
LNITAMRTQSSQLLINHLSSSFDEWGLFPLFRRNAGQSGVYSLGCVGISPVGCLNAG